MPAFVVFFHARLNVVRGINVNFAVENVGRRVGGVDVFDQRLRNGFGVGSGLAKC